MIAMSGVRRGLMVVAAILSALVGVAGTGLLSLLGAVLTGKLVPVSRVERAQAEAATWKQSHDTIQRAFDSQARLLERQQLTAEITDKVMVVVKDHLASTAAPAATSIAAAAQGADS